MFNPFFWKTEEEIKKNGRTNERGSEFYSRLY